MLTPCLTYFIKVHIALGLFFAFYRLFFSKDTFFILRRFLLLSFFALAFLYPLFDIQEWIKEQHSLVEAIHLYSTMLLPEATVTAIPPGLWHFAGSTFLYLFYAAVSVGLGIRFFIQLGSIIRLGYHTRPAILNGYQVRLLDRPGGPFSFFRLIFLHPADYTEKEIQEILVHERTHVTQWHSLDVLLSEWLCIVCWINPFAWLLKREVRHNLEYLADHCVLEAGYDSKSYQYHLLGLAHATPAPPGLYTNFHLFHLKNRIRMMNKKRSCAIGRAKYLLFIPLAALLLVCSNIEALARITRHLAEASTAPPSPVKIKATEGHPNHRPLADVNVARKESSVATQTDRADTFEVNAPAGGARVLSRSGLDPQEIKAIEPVAELDREVFTNEDPSRPVYKVVDEMPRYPGGDEALLQFIARNIIYPDEALQTAKQGRVVCAFIVEKDGAVSHVKVLRGIYPSLDKEAARVIASLPAWKPGKVKGQAVRVAFTVPITFRLS